jgi:hypothetical protein
MPKSRVKKKKLFREASAMQDRYVKDNYLKDLRSKRLMFCESNKISFSHLEFLLWAYDKEFWTINFASSEYGMNKNNMGDRIVYPLLKEDMVYKHFDKLTPSNDPDAHMFREETKYSYRVRYAITQKARLLVQRFYALFKDD